MTNKLGSIVFICLLVAIGSVAILKSTSNNLLVDAQRLPSIWTTNQDGGAQASDQSYRFLAELRLVDSAKVSSNSIFVERMFVVAEL